jgi:glycosyltransferase involved in cell wall biosynthesis
MRIAVVTETYPPEINGVALTVAGFVSALAAEGHAVHLVRPLQDGVAATNPPPRVDETLVRGAPVPRYPGLRMGLPAGAELKRLWRARRPDAVYIATEGPLGWSALRTAEALGIPVATGFHTRFDDYMAHYGAGLLGPLVSGWLRRFHNRAHATLVPTAELVDQLTRAGFRAVRRLARGVDIRRFDPARRDPALRARWGVRDDDPVLLVVGRIAAEKNLELAARAADAMRARLPRARLVWVGDGPAAAALRAARPGDVHCGLQRGEALAAHYASADLFLFPSLTETFGNVTLEAMASGLPVLAFDYGAAREHLRDGVHGRVVPRGDEAAYLAAAEALAADVARWPTMGRAARAAVLPLEPAQVARNLAGVLSGLATGRAA